MFFWHIKLVLHLTNKFLKKLFNLDKYKHLQKNEIQPNAPVFLFSFEPVPSNAQNLVFAQGSLLVILLEPYLVPDKTQL